MTIKFNLLKRYAPTTNGLRHIIKIDKTSLLKDSKIIKSLKIKKTVTNGRSTMFGNITAWHRGGGHKQRKRLLDTPFTEQLNVVLGTSYNPNRSTFNTIFFDLLSKKIHARLGSENLYPGTLTKTTETLTEFNTGNRSMIKSIPIGTLIHNIILPNQTKPKYINSAGTFGQIIKTNPKISIIKLPSNKLLRIDSTATATIGINTNSKHNQQQLGKAGVNRALNRRPITRGIAMNPVDHPHGGRTNGGRPSVSPWGLPTKCGFYLKRRSKKNKKNYE